jgi:hypothetical protein
VVRQQHGHEGDPDRAGDLLVDVEQRRAAVYRDPVEEDRVWAVFDWDEEGWTAFATDPETPGIMQEAGHLGRPSLGQFLGTFPG